MQIPFQNTENTRWVFSFLLSKCQQLRTSQFTKCQYSAWKTMFILKRKRSLFFFFHPLISWIQGTSFFDKQVKVNMVNFFFPFLVSLLLGKKQQYNNNDNNNDNKRRKKKRKEKLNMWNVFSLLVYDAFISGVIGRTLSGQSLQFSLCGRDWSHGVNCFHREGGRRLCEGVARKDKSAFNHNKKMIIQQYKQLSPPVFVLGITISFDHH